MRRRWLVGVLIAVDVLVVLVVLLVWRPWDGDDQGDGPALSERLAPVAAPPGFVLTTAYGSDALAGTGGTGVAVVLADDGATLDDGRWVGIVTLPATAERADPDVLFPGEDRQPVTASAVNAVAGETYDGRVGVTAGPVQGRLISVVGQDVTIDELVAVAAQVAEAGAGTPTGAEALDGTIAGDMDVVGSTGFATGDVTSSVAGAVLLPSEGSAALTYQPTAGGLAIQVANRAAPQDADRLLRFLLGDDTVQVHGREAVVGEARLAAFGLSAVAWEEGGRLIAVSGPAPAAGLVAFAESVQELDPAAWQQLLDSVS